MQLAIRTSGLGRDFGKTCAVEGLDLEVPAGAVTGFLGPNGSGKTTTIRMLLGLLRPTRGTIEIFGRPMPAERMAIVRDIGAMVETPCHYDHLTGRENLAVTQRMLGLAPDAVERGLALVGLGPAASQRVGGYSLGMRQRLGIARAMLGKPRLLILDEPVNALDPEGIIDMRGLIRSLAKDHGLTILVSSHLLAEVELTADHVALIARGRLLAQGRLGAILGTAGSTIMVKASRPGDAAALLRSKGMTVTARNHGRLAIAKGSETAAADVARLLHESGFALSELGEERPSLERAYLELTGARSMS